MRRGDVFIGEIVEYQHNCLLLFIEEIGRTVLLDAQEILGGLKAKHKTMVGVPIAVRIKSLRPFAVSNKFIDKNDLRRKMRQWELLKTQMSTTQPVDETEVIEDIEDTVEEATISGFVESKTIPFGIMVWWSKCEEAAIYQLKLFINNEKLPLLATVEVERNTFYHTFTGLAAQNYLIEITAENREGEVIARGTTSQSVDDLFHVYGYTGG